MKQRVSHSLVTTGIPSVFLVFSVLCLVILSLLSVGASQTDLRTSEKSLAQAKAYYEASSWGSSLLRQAKQYLGELRLMADQEDSFYTQAREYFESLPGISRSRLGSPESLENTSDYHVELVLWDSTEKTVRLEIPYSQRLSLAITMTVHYPDDPEGNCLELNSWYTSPETSWTPEAEHNLYQPGDLF